MPFPSEVPPPSDHEPPSSSEATAEDRAYYVSLFKNNHAVTLLVDPESGRIEDANPAAASFYGYARDELVGKTVAELTTLSEEELRRKMAAARAAGRRPFHFRHRVSSGAVRDVEVYSGPINIDGRRLLYSIVHDVTAQRRAEAALRASEQRYRMLFERSPDAIVIHRDDEIVHVNAAAGRLAGMPPAMLAGRSLYEFVQPQEHAVVEEQIRRIGRGQRVTPLEVTLQNAEGRTFVVESVAATVTWKGEEVIQSILRDVTERKHLEQTLRKQALLFEHGHDAIIIRGPDGRITEWGPIAEAIFGYRRKDALGQTLELLAAPAHADDASAPIDRELAEAGSWRGEMTFVHKEGHEILCESYFGVLTDASGRTVGSMAIMHDLTKERARETRLRESEETFRRLVEHSLVGITIVQQQRFTYVNPRAADIFGYRPEEMIGRPVRDVVHPQDWPTVEAHIQQRLSGDRIESHYTLRGRRRDGETVDLEVHGTVARTEGAASIITSWMDVTDRRRAEADLRLHGAALRAAANSIVITDRTGTIVWANPAFTRLTGYEADEVIGGSPRVLQSGVQDEAFYARMWATIQAGDVWHGELVNRRKDGTLYNEEMTITPVTDGRGEITHFIAIKQDVTLRTQHEAELVRAKEAAEEMAHLKDAFLSNMSHEIRTPLAAILGASSVLQDEVQGEARELVSYIRSGGERLMETLNSVLDLAQLERRAVVMQPEPLRVVSAVEETLALFRPQASRRGLYLHLEADLPPEADVLADRAALGRVLANLFSNALKFTDEGGVTVRVGAARGEVVLEVADTGTGISSDFLPHVFDEFRQESTGHTRQYDGNGLGLSICRQLVQLMDGTISVRSEKGAGSTFTVRLPAAAHDAGRHSEAPPARADTQPDRQHVLLVDDEDSIRQLVTQMLKAHTAIDAAAGGDEALRLARRHRYDAVLLDINLRSREDGVRVLQELRALTDYAAVPIIALTAYALPGDRERYLAAGFDAYLGKPFSRAELTQILDDVRRTGTTDT